MNPAVDAVVASVGPFDPVAPTRGSMLPETPFTGVVVAMVELDIVRGVALVMVVEDLCRPLWP